MGFNTAHQVNNSSILLPNPHRAGSVPLEAERCDVDTPTRIWGLTIEQLHDAYWKSCGVQCVRCGQHKAVERGSDLLLLLEPGHLVLFELDAIMKRLVWHGASVTRVGLENESSGYLETAVLDGEGFIQRIERRYASHGGSQFRAHLTHHRRIAQQWRDHRNQCAWKNALRESYVRPLVDRVRCAGRSFRLHDRDDEHQFLTTLIDQWKEPNCVIDGIKQIVPGVWMRQGAKSPEKVMIGPIWIGDNVSGDVPESYIVGPTWTVDSKSSEQIELPPVKVLPFSQVCVSGQHLQQPEKSPTTSSTLYPHSKRVVDVCVSLAVLLTLWPLMLVVALAIVWDDGFPVLFRHRRQSQHGRSFGCLKFRTMRRDAEAMACNLHDKNRCDGPQICIDDDPRVTHVGRMLRRWHLDELPQFWNVLKGEMSIVGPRPSPERENRICPAWRELRLSVRPGITGLWQIKRTRHPGKDFQEWIRYDIEYVRTAGFWLDISICMQTVLLMLLKRRN